MPFVGVPHKTEYVSADEDRLVPLPAHFMKTKTPLALAIAIAGAILLILMQVGLRLPNSHRTATPSDRELFDASGDLLKANAKLLKSHDDLCAMNDGLTRMVTELTSSLEKSNDSLKRQAAFARLADIRAGQIMSALIQKLSTNGSESITLDLPPFVPGSHSGVAIMYNGLDSYWAVSNETHISISIVNLNP